MRAAYMIREAAAAMPARCWLLFYVAADGTLRRGARYGC